VPDSIPAAVLRQYGKPPEFTSFEAPPAPSDGQLLVEVEVAGLNPVDVALGERRYTTPSPPVPYVPGSEAVGRVLESAVPGVARGDRVYVDAPALPHGTFASRTLAYGASAYKLADDVDAATACALGIVGVSAHGALVHRARLHPGESVAVLGATGAVGAVAVQIARLLSAESIVAVGRNVERLEAARELGATATARIGDDDIEAVIRDGTGGDGASVVVDMLCGPPAEAALEAMAVGGRLVQMGRSAAETMEIRSAVVRGRTLSIIGHTYMRMPPEIRHVAYEWLLQKAASGELSVETETVSLAEVADAWMRQKSSPGHKLVIAP
jgi:NADPH:quinone reductase-like Zn-dependent oxidoreductase